MHIAADHAEVGVHVNGARFPRLFQRPFKGHLLSVPREGAVQGVRIVHHADVRYLLSVDDNGKAVTFFSHEQDIIALIRGVVEDAHFKFRDLGAADMDVFGSPCAEAHLEFFVLTARHHQQREERQETAKDAVELFV